MRVYKEPSQLSQYERMQGDFKLLWPMVKEALRLKLWLFDKQQGRWYTPEEFLDQYQKKNMNNYEVKTLQENVIIRDPRTGNAAYHKEIEKRIEQFHLEISELRSKGEAFLNKVMSYYHDCATRGKQ
jgi:hypothetical protein